MGKTILSPNQRSILERAAADLAITDQYYLTGGTALAEFYFRHRISEDLDFFSEKSIDEAELAKWVQVTAKTLSVDVTFQTLREQLIYYFHFPHDVVKVDFANFPFEHLGEFKRYKRLRIASIEDIATNKLQAIMTRSRGRDYVDLYEILTNGRLSIERLTQQYRLKFDVSIPPEQLAKRFNAVLDATDIPRFLGDRSWNSVEAFFVTQVKLLKPKILQ